MSGPSTVVWVTAASDASAPWEPTPFSVDRVPVDPTDSVTSLADTLLAGDPACVVCEFTLPGDCDGLDLLQAIRERDQRVPVVLHTAVPDGEVASEAIALDVTDYCYGDNLAGRVASVVETPRPPDTETQQEALHRLHQIITDPDGDFETTTSRLLELGCSYLGLDIGFVTRFTDGTQHIVTATGDHTDIQAGASAPLSESYCRHTVEAEELVGYRDAAEELADDPAFERFGLGCYLGGKLFVDGELYGTLCFADDDAREVDFTRAERRFVEVMVDWYGNELDRRSATNATEQARAELDRVLERVDDAFFALDDEKQFTYVNGEVEELLEVEAADLVGRSVDDLFEKEHLEPFISQYEQAMATQEPVSFEAYFEPLSMWFDANAYPAPDGVSVYFRDVTRRKRRESMLDDLLGTMRELVQADTTQAVADIVVRAAQNILELDYVAVRLHDPDTDRLDVVAGTDHLFEDLPDRPTYGSDEGNPGTAFTAGESFDSPIDYHDEIQSARYVPLGDYGVVSVASREADPVDDIRRGVLDVLATNATAALDRAERQETLREYETVLENVQDMVYVLDEDGYYSYVTEPFADFLGCDRADLLGERPGQFLRAEGQSAVEERMAAFTDHDPDVAKTYEVTIQTAEDRTVPVEIESTTLPQCEEADGFPGSVGVVRDLSDLHRTREELESENERFRNLFASIPDPVVENEFRDGEPIVSSVNDAFESVFGYDAEAVVGESINDFIVPPDRQEEAATLDSQADNDEIITAEVRRRTATGNRDFLFRGVGYDLEDGTRAGYGIYTDITAQKERERRLEVLHTVLRHNLRTELTLVSGYLDLLADDVDAPDRIAQLRGAVTEIENLSAKARTLERVVADEDDSHPDPTDIVPQVRAVVDAERDRYPDTTIRLDVPPNATAVADDRLGLAMTNLLENAVEHGGEQVAVTVVDDDSTVTVRVADDGPGLPERERALVQGERDITQLEHGSGLGLWVVDAAVRSLGGDLSFAAVDDGCVVDLSLRKT
ncbi:PAS domain S-box protein [Haloarchaeobius sp. DT45]|uniref:PAS domain S-box protein n=1 Tax=Haloarchaeobius sp. DT45 TaxID=3446116 RepID=UPI003F6A5D52